jgi:Hypervirulence associated proteins TUDOR domain
MTEEFNKGDKVKWNTAQGETTGEVEKKLTSPTDIKKHHAAASKDNPQYLLKSDKTGKEAAHKPDALEKIEE